MSASVTRQLGSWIGVIDAGGKMNSSCYQSLGGAGHFENCWHYYAGRGGISGVWGVDRSSYRRRQYCIVFLIQ